MGLLAADAEVAAVAAACLRIVAASYVFWGFGLVTVVAFNGASDTTTPAWINFFVYWVVQLPLAWTLAGPAGMGPTGRWAVCQTLMVEDARAVGRGGARVRLAIEPVLLTQIPLVADGTSRRRRCGGWSRCC